jgi:hypothetical protein
MENDMVNSGTWPSQSIDIDDLMLDPENPRLDLKKNASQKDIIYELYKNEEITDLAEDIILNGGLFPTENIIVMKQGNKFLTLEGNRRVCAIKSLLDSSIVPDEYKNEVQNILENIEDNTLLDKLKKLNAIISPDRDQAEPLITAKHSVYAVKKWGYVSKWKRDYNAYKQNGGIDKTAGILGENPKNIEESIRSYNLLKYLKNIFRPDNSEAKMLNDLHLPVIKFYYHLSMIKDKLKISFDSNYEVQIGIDRNEADYILSKLVYACFMVSGNGEISTRTSKTIVENYIDGWKKEYERNYIIVDPPTPIPGIPTSQGRIIQQSKRPRTKRKNGKYFENLTCGIADNRLNQVTQEISKIDPQKFPIASLILTRSLIELSLMHRIELKGRKREFKKQYPRDVNSLDDIVKYTITNAGSLFKEEDKVKNALGYIQGEGKDRKFLNDVVHNTSYAEPTASHLESIAADVKEVIQIILNDEE